METKSAVIALSALAQETRLEIFRALVAAGPGGVPAGNLAEILGIAPATLSFHLKELRSAGLVHCARAGRQRIYSPNFGTVRALIGFLGENCCEGDSNSDSQRGPTLTSQLRG